MTKEDIAILELFIKQYPTWWWKIGWCDVTRDFDCAPQGHSPEIKYIESGIWPDDCFSCDHTGSIADAILNVMTQISIATPINNQ